LRKFQNPEIGTLICLARQHRDG